MADIRLYVHPSSGYTSLVGPALHRLAAPYVPLLPLASTSNQRHTSLHITLLTKSEAASLRAANLPNPFLSPSVSPFTAADLLPLGLGSSPAQPTTLSFLALLLPRAQAVRLSSPLPLPPKDFHISLRTPPGTSPEDFPHGVETLVHPLEVGTVEDKRVLDALAREFLLRGEGEKAFQAAGRLCALPLTGRASEGGAPSAREWIRLGDAATKTQRFKVAMLAYARAVEAASRPSSDGEGDDASQEKEAQYALRRLVKSGDSTEWGTTFFSFEAAQFETLDGLVKEALLRPWSEELKETVREKVEENARERGWVPRLRVEGRERAVIRAEDGEEVQLMRNLRWILPFTLAVSSIPRSSSDISLLASPPLGIRHIITLSAESPLPRSCFALNPHVRHTHLPIPDMRAPTVEQMQLFLRIVVSSIHERDEPVLVHCGAGKGRAGTMVAAYLIAFGFSRPPDPLEEWTYPAYAPAQALDLLRAIRPESVETGEQEASLKLFYSRIVRDGRPFPLPPSLPSPSPEPHLDGILDGADLVVLVGLPGSGKSEFRRSLLARDLSWRAVSGDEDGKTSAVLAACSSFRGGARGDKLVVDRCSISRSSRLELLAHTHRASHPVCIFFSTLPSLCLHRAQNRPDHPSLPPGPRVRAALKQFERDFESPSRDEGWSAVVTVEGEEAAREAVRRLAGGGSGLLKFPRTAHLFNLGAATADDLLSPSAHSPSSAATTPAALFPSLLTNPSLSLVLTEKLDGANLGFSLSSPPPHRLLVQNRSHYLAVEPGSRWTREGGEHEQFRRLGEWMGEREAELRTLLGDDEEIPERWILYGEWMAATHSVHYTSLPSLFHAFDLYDRLTHTFLPRPLLAARLKHLAPSIPLVPLLYAGRGDEVQTRETLERMVQGRSAYMGAEVGDDEASREGVYVKVEDGERVVERFKVVRGDFIAGNEHWSKGRIRLNGVCVEDAEA